MPWSFSSTIDMAGLGDGADNAHEHMFQNYLKDMAAKLQAMQGKCQRKDTEDKFQSWRITVKV